jgi:HD-GYP domain-containing protein (c-di-GMP phosphodiesterase class II)
VHALASRLIDDVRDGRTVNGKQVRSAMEQMVESLLRNADAMFWLVGLMKRDDYAYSHAVNCSALATALGRQLALPRDVLVELATGGLLLDVGKARVPDALYQHQGALSEEARKLMEGHVGEGLKVIEDSGIASTWVRDMLGSHHERHDGGGYPEGLAGLQIPLGGRIGALADTYDALTSVRPHRRAISRHEALQTIYRAGNSLFQAELVEQFMQSLGVYPTGSLVELNTGQVGIVMAQNQARRLRPRVMLLLTADKVAYQPYRDIDLMAETSEDGMPVTIVAALEPGAYGLDPADLYLA